MIHFCSNPLSADDDLPLDGGCTLRLGRHFDDLPAGHWEAVTEHKQFFLQAEYLRIMEAQAPANMKFWYALAYDKEKPVVAMLFQVIYLDEKLLGEIFRPVGRSQKYFAFLAGWREWLRKGSGKVSMRLLVSGNNFISGEHGLAFVPALESTEAFRILACTVHNLLKIDREDGLISAVLVKDYGAGLAVPARTLRRHRYYHFKVEPAMMVKKDPAWNSFDDYVAAMSKKYRNRAKAVLRKSAAVEVVELDAEAALREAPVMQQLYMNLHNKAAFRMASLPEGNFAAMKKALGAGFSIYAYYHQGRMIGFRSAFFPGDMLDAHFIGVDYTVNDDFSLYQRILYDYVAEGISRGVKNIHLGRTASEIKSTIGAEPFDLTCFIRHRNPFTNHLLRHFIEYLEPQQWVQRHPFRETVSEKEALVI